jgi:hypothetical protein
VIHEVLDAVIFADYRSQVSHGVKPLPSAGYLTATSSAEPLPTGRLYVPCTITVALVSQYPLTETEACSYR